MIQVEVCYASADQQFLQTFAIAENSTIRDAIEKSNVLQIFPEIDLKKNAIGVYNRICDLNDILAHGDRVEIYRSLLIDPKDARRERAAIQNKKDR